jgi:hypothetical protein
MTLIKTGRVVVLPGAMICDCCGYLIAADPYQHGEAYHVVRCMTLGCAMRGVGLKFPLTFVDCDTTPSEENPHGEATLNGSHAPTNDSRDSGPGAGAE